jgi:hypothetical protein
MADRVWPYDGPEGRARLTGNLGTEDWPGWPRSPRPPQPEPGPQPLPASGACICGKGCAPCEECGRPPELHDKSEGSCEPLPEDVEKAVREQLSEVPHG